MPAKHGRKTELAISGNRNCTEVPASLPLEQITSVKGGEDLVRGYLDRM